MSTTAAESGHPQTADSAPDFVRDAFGDSAGPVQQPADGVMLAALLAIESSEPHPGVYAFVQAATGVAFDMGFTLPTTVNFVRHVRNLYVQLLAEPTERQAQLAPEFGEEFVEAVINELPEDRDSHKLLDMAMLRYEHVMRATAFALTAADAADNGAGPRAKGG